MNQHAKRAVGGLMIAGVAGAVAWQLALGPEVRCFNDSDSVATVTVEGRTFTVAPRTWAPFSPGYGPHQVSVTFANGEKASFPVNLTRRADYPTVANYALAAKGCFALLDVSALYGQPGRVTPLAVFEHTHLLEKHLDHATELPPGPLPKETITNRQYSTLVWVTPVACGLAGDPSALGQELEKLTKRRGT